MIIKRLFFTLSLLIFVLVSVFGLTGCSANKTPQTLNITITNNATIYLYRDWYSLRYYAIDCRNSKLICESEDPVEVIETALEYVPTNSRVVFGGHGGWYLNRTLVIDGKKDGKPTQDDRGFHEVIIDASQIEFVMKRDKNRDFIVVDTMYGCELYIGVIGASPAEGYAALSLKPTLSSQYRGGAGAHWSKVRVQIISSSGCDGIGVKIDGSEARGGVQYMDIEVKSVDGYKKNVLFCDPTPKRAYGNKIVTNRNIPAKNGIGIQDGEPGCAERMFNNHYETGISSVGAEAGIVIYGRDSTYELYVTDADPKKAMVIQPGAFRNIVYGNHLLKAHGWTDDSGGSSNTIIVP